MAWCKETYLVILVARIHLVECISTTSIFTITLVKNNQDVYEYGGDGFRSFLLGWIPIHFLAKQDGIM
ncbi:MAG: hypothetical protein PHS99_06715 [Candidatus Marinimicrobia bacterium]|nr:hypothetical protein [Candidatus Neomarinimicrobiota bacterium]